MGRRLLSAAMLAAVFAPSLARRAATALWASRGLDVGNGSGVSGQ